MADTQRIPAGQADQAIRQIIRGRHHRALDQDRNNPHTTGQGGLDFQPHQVLRIFKPSTAPLVGRGQPARADDGQQHRTGRHRTEDFLSEVLPGLDRIHIDEDVILAETLDQPVIQPTGHMARFLSAVADEDPPALSYGHV